MNGCCASTLVFLHYEGGNNFNGEVIIGKDFMNGVLFFLNFPLIFASNNKFDECLVFTFRRIPVFAMLQVVLYATVKRRGVLDALVLFWVKMFATNF